MGYLVRCRICGDEGQMTQRRGVKLKDYLCTCGGELHRARLGATTAAMVAADLLKETGNPAIGWGDSGLLHMVADKLGLPSEGYATEKKILDRIERSYQGVLIKRWKSYGGGKGVGRLREYALPEVLAEVSCLDGRGVCSVCSFISNAPDTGRK